MRGEEAMQAIRQWLEGLGLAEYAAAFEANDVGLDVLPTLTEEDLQRLGVSLGDRKRILLALLKSRSTAGMADSLIESLTAQGERRQVTVLFCDLVGSTALSNTHDPEEYRAILARYHETSIAEIQRFEGFVAQIQGDGILAYFGYPLAHENEADRAVRAGLRIVESIRDARLDQPLQVRIGIASGLVVVSHILAPEKSAVGETPNLAARLQTIAQPGEVLLGDRTRLLAGGAFEYEERGTHILKGIAGPTRAWKVVGQSRVTSRFEAATRGSVLPMIGREQEIGLMLDRWENSRSGKGQVVFLQGEPGIGKSRLLQSFRERVAGRMEMALQYHCSPYHTNSAFYPIADHLERALEFGRDDTAEQRLDKIERYLLGFQFLHSLPYASNAERGNKDHEAGKTECRLLARVLGISCDERYGSMKMSPQRQKDDTISLLVDLVAAIAMRQATAVIFEDLHWADPTTLEVLGSLINRSESLPLLILTTYRPEFVPHWKRGPHITHIGLARLSRTQSANMVLRVAGSKPLGSDLVSQIVDKTDGVPLYVEELTKAVLESSVVVDRGDRYDHSGARDKMGIPATLRDSLMARLDRLVPVKEIAQMGACLGREFSYELVRAISPMSKAQLDEALEKTYRVGVGVSTGTPARRGVRIQARACAGRCLRFSAQDPPASIARRDCQESGRALPGDLRHPARVACAPLHSCGYARTGRPLLEACRRTGPYPHRLARGHCSSRARARGGDDACAIANARSTRTRTTRTTGDGMDCVARLGVPRGGGTPGTGLCARRSANARPAFTSRALGTLGLCACLGPHSTISADRGRVVDPRARVRQ
jgi:class 3 adenylate cyclase